jgi:hypothetical protein
MRRLLIALAFLLPVPLMSQSFTQVAVSGLQYALAGSHDAVLQSDYFYPIQVKKAFPGYQLGRDTEGNKYKNGIPAQGAKFPLSTTLLVPFTDDYHRVQFQRNALLFIDIGSWEWPNQKNWYEYKKDYKYKPIWASAAESIFKLACFNVGKELTFQYIQNN